jgi:CheY-like chemotaxis protein
MVVEDEEVLRDAYCYVLRADGYETYAASDGSDALALLPSVKPDIILLDMLMPGVNGLEFLQRAGLKESYPKTRVIIFSNLSDTPNIEQAMALGAERNVLKSSMSPRQLVELVASSATLV